MPMPSTPPPASSFQGLGNDPAGMLDAGTSRGDFVTRTWQPTPAPDSVAVEALMLGPLAKDVGGALAGMKTSVGASGSRPTEDDGLIVRQRPRARADNIARRKQRAAQEDRPDDWFDPEDGGLRCQADPVPPAPSALARPVGSTRRPPTSRPSPRTIFTSMQIPLHSPTAVPRAASPRIVRFAWRFAPAGLNSRAIR